MRYEGLFHNLLSREIEVQLEKMTYIGLEKFHTNTINGFRESLTNIIEECVLHPKRDKYYDDRIVGYHIYASKVRDFYRNKLAQHLDERFNYKIFTRVWHSNYHANNSRGESNGYTYWYTMPTWISDAYKLAKYRLSRMLEHDETYKNKSQKYHQLIIDMLKVNDKSTPPSVGNYLKIRRNIFIREYDFFTIGLSPQFSIVLNKVFYWDRQYIYIDNTPYSVGIDGHGRSYTLVSTLSSHLRKRLLEGYIEIDMDTAVQSIFLNIHYMNTIKGGVNADQMQWKKDFPEHYKLITSKVKFRGTVAFLFKVNTSTAKKIITHLTYSPDANVIHTYAKDKAPAVKAKIKNWLKVFRREARILRESVLEKFYYQKNDHNPNLAIGDITLREFKPLIDEDIRVNNLHLKGGGRGKKLDDRRASRITTLIEKQLRDTLISYLKDFTHENMYQIHDAVILKVQDNGLKKVNIEKHIKDTLGFTLTVTPSKV